MNESLLFLSFCLILILLNNKIDKERKETLFYLYNIDKKGCKWNLAIRQKRFISVLNKTETIF